jgi:hypothetical protein
VKWNFPAERFSLTKNPALTVTATRSKQFFLVYKDIDLTTLLAGFSFESVVLPTEQAAHTEKDVKITSGTICVLLLKRKFAKRRSVMTSK